MSRHRAVVLSCVFVAFTVPAAAEPVGWAQLDGPGSEVLLTYSFANLDDGGFNSTLTYGEMRALTTRALEIWAGYAPLNFLEVPDAGPPPGEQSYVGGSADIRIGYQPELASGHAAHAHLPYERSGTPATGLAGDIHLSNDTSAFGTSRWGDGSRDPLALDFFSVMLHELGHSLGLHHLEGDAIMGMTLLMFSDPDHADLRPADIAALRAIYGAGTGSVIALSEQPLATPEPATLVLLGGGLALLARHRFQRSIAARRH